VGKVPEEKVGEVEHYFGKISVAAIRLTAGELRIGDTVRFKGKTTDFQQTVDSIQIEHSSVESAAAGDEIGVKVAQRVREGDEVYKVTS